VWQLQRREWKLEQLAERERQLAQPPLPLRTLSAGEAGEWRRVEGQGELRGRASYVRPLSPLSCAAPLASHAQRRWGRAFAPWAAPRARDTCWCACWGTS